MRFSWWSPLRFAMIGLPDRDIDRWGVGFSPEHA
jgi:hypothetical protein